MPQYDKYSKLLVFLAKLSTRQVGLTKPGRWLTCWQPGNEARLPRRKIMKIRPLHDRILAKRLAEQEKTAAGLFLPDTAKEKPLAPTAPPLAPPNPLAT